MSTKIAIFTAVEVITLVVWLALALQATDILSGLIAVTVLIIGFTLEHLITYNVVHNRPLFNFKGLPIGQKFIVSLIETGIWVVWLVLLQSGVFDWTTGLVVATVFMFVTLLVEHTVSDNVFTKRPLFSRIIERRTIGFTIIEAVGAGIWFALVDVNLAVLGILILTIASFSEHILSVRLSQGQNKNEKRNTHQ